jgi:DNA-binding beta-propeller fold protein YncE
VNRFLALIGLAALLVPATSLAAGPAGSVIPRSCAHDGATSGSCLGVDGLAGANGIAVSTDGRLLAVSASEPAATSTTLTTFAVDPTTGDLTPADCLAAASVGACRTGHDLDGLTGVALRGDRTLAFAVATADGATEGAVLAFTVDAGGTLAQPAGDRWCYHAAVAVNGSCRQDPELGDASALALSPDGKFLYVASGTQSAITGYAVGLDGSLTRLAGSAGCIAAAPLEGPGSCQDDNDLRSPSALAVSPDGKNLYVTAGGAPGAIMVLARNTVTGALAKDGDAGFCIVDGNSAGSCGAGHDLADAAGVAISPDGAHVFVAATGGGITAYNRSATDGSITPVAINGCIHGAAAPASDCQDGHDLDGATAVAVTADGRTLLVTAGTSGALVGLSIGAGGSITQPTGATSCAHAGPATGACAQVEDLIAPAAVATTGVGSGAWVASSGSFLDALPGSITGFRGEHAPVCDAASLTAERGVATTLTVHCADADGDPITYAIRSGSGYGATVSAIAASGAFTYTPPTTFTGTDAVTFTASDGTNVSAPATAAIVVADHVAPKLSLSFASVHGGGGSVRIRVRCTGDDPCAGSLKLRAGSKVIGTATFTVAAGKTATVKVKLTAATKRRLRRGRIAAVARVTVHDAAGNSATASAKATLRR